MYNESLGRWRTADLLIGLAYLARQETANRAIEDIAAAGQLVGKGKSVAERLAIVVRFQQILVAFWKSGGYILRQEC